jgi:hypothetical protein
MSLPYTEGAGKFMGKCPGKFTGNSAPARADNSTQSFYYVCKRSRDTVLDDLA